MTNKFDGNLWKWLLTNVMGKLAPSTEEATEGQVLTVGDEGAMEWANPSTGRDVPDASGATDGDVLTVDGEGGYGWEALPTVREVPSAAAASDGDVLTADGSGGFAWETPGGGSAAYSPTGWYKYTMTTTQQNGQGYGFPVKTSAMAGVTADPIAVENAGAGGGQNGYLEILWFHKESGKTFTYIPTVLNTDAMIIGSGSSKNVYAIDNDTGELVKIGSVTASNSTLYVIFYPADYTKGGGDVILCHYVNKYSETVAAGVLNAVS